jgi:dihydrofolate reductase
MRKLIYAINLTLDGCCDHTKAGAPDEDLYNHYIALLRDADTFLYGRKTYQLMVPFWPDRAKSDAGDEYARAFVAVDKIVVCSKSLEKVEGKNTKIIREGLQEQILKLKEGPGKNILTGGVDIPSQLIQLGLVDEFNIVVYPVMVGEGRRLFDNVSFKRLQLKLVESKVFESGSVLLRYVKN